MISSVGKILFIIEIIIIASVILYQIYFSIQQSKKINLFKKIFTYKLSVVKGTLNKNKMSLSNNVLENLKERCKPTPDLADHSEEIVDNESPEDLIYLSLVDTISDNITLIRIKNTLNSYLVNNYGTAVNFSIIKDIVDREIDVSDEEITQSIPTPLYLGLAATMIGIIFGLFSMPSIDNNDFTLSINSLINGVKIAMIASLIGLLCTTILSSFIYKPAKRRTILEKNDQLSYLQAKLLPELVKAEESGIFGLKTSLDKFTREATDISRNVLSASKITNENITKQNDLIKKVEDLNMTKLSKINLQLFERIENNFEILNEFNGYLSLLNKISNNLVLFAQRTSNFEVIGEEIKNNISNANKVIEMVHTHSQSLTAYVEQIKQSGGSAMEAVNLADSSFREAIFSLQGQINASIEQLGIKANNLNVELNDHFNNVNVNLKDATSIHLQELTAAYEKSTPQFTQLENLILLPEMRDSINKQSTDFLKEIEELKQSLITISIQLTDTQIHSKPDTIDKVLNKEDTPLNNEPKDMKKSSLLTSIKSLFRLNIKNEKQ